MANTFNGKFWNGEVFEQYYKTIPDTKRNELIKSGAITPSARYKKLLGANVGGNFVVVPMVGLLGGSPVNYDGNTDITVDTLDTYKQGVVVIGRAKAWSEKDFAYELTHTDWMSEIAKQVHKYWENVDQDTLLSILKGIFAGNALNSHKVKIEDVLGATSINSACQVACGDNKDSFAIAILHSAVATNLENLNVLNYLKYTDANGIQRDLALATINGKAVIIDDSVPLDTSISIK